MNRLQKRQQAALEKRKRRISTNGQAIAHYRDTATLWARGAVLTGRHIDGVLDGEWTFAPHVPAHKYQAVAEYATHAPFRWHITAHVMFQPPMGDRYTVTAEAECGQTQLITELHGLREALLTDARKGGNTKHGGDEWFEMKIIV